MLVFDRQIFKMLLPLLIITNRVRENKLIRQEFTDIKKIIKIIIW